MIGAQEAPRMVTIRDITTIEGVRENPLIGYGMVVGLNGTGDRTQTFFTTQTLSGILQRMGVQVPSGSMRVNNVASVMVTAVLPPFAVHGGRIDVTVSSIGDAKSLDGGMLLLTPLYGADGQVYAAAQGALAIGGYSASSNGNSKQSNHPTVGRIPEGGVIEKDLSVGLEKLSSVSLLLRDPEFATATSIAAEVNRSLASPVARAVDARRVVVGVRPETSVPELLAKIQSLEIPLRERSRIIVNERTGTIVMGAKVQLSAVAVLHGNLSVEITSSMAVSQPAPLSNGSTVRGTETNLEAREAPVKLLELKEGATVAQLVEGLQKIGATARDVVSILQAMKAAGALQAEVEVL
ncbi:flagellar P-ring protein [Candidatus Koribacter versatilis Ellin345]|uniref:Flagellar P-ring protein n=2 Tax=Candidatus Korobacter versatilis TaxID=658062 RepID=Q1IMH3_KORVE|nr:flagellar P-ring protein [Candidatus Koribacter versatilis Ellin345]